jgi:predicted nucleotidyltransferase
MLHNHSTMGLDGFCEHSLTSSMRTLVVALLCVFLNAILICFFGEDINFTATSAMGNFHSYWLPLITSITGTLFWYKTARYVSARIGRIPIIDFVAGNTFTIMACRMIFIFEKLENSSRLFRRLGRGNEQMTNSENSDVLKHEAGEEFHIPKIVLEELRELGKKYEVKSILLFGSRARGQELPKSDIDLAVCGCRNFYDLAYDIDNHTSTLLSFDIINMDDGISEKLKQEIARDGVLIYGEI